MRVVDVGFNKYNGSLQQRIIRVMYILHIMVWIAEEESAQQPPNADGYRSRSDANALMAAIKARWVELGVQKAFEVVRDEVRAILLPPHHNQH